MKSPFTWFVGIIMVGVMLAFSKKKQPQLPSHVSKGWS